MESYSGKTIIGHWLAAFRLRTLPLTLASIGMGSFLAAALGNFSWIIFILTVTTTIFLQILSNLSNDYGDSIHGADSIERQGPQRAVQSGTIAPKTMLKAMILFTLLALGSGLLLLYIAVMHACNFQKVLFQLGHEIMGLLQYWSIFLLPPFRKKVWFHL